MAMSTEEPTTGNPSDGAPMPSVAPAGAFLPDVPALPEGSVLLHVGVHKTGTTAIQAAFADARDELREHGVYYPGKRPAHHRAALAILNRPWGWQKRGGESYDRSVFDNLADQVRRHEGRTVVSSEFFCETDQEAATEVVRELGGDNVHVVITLRNLGSLLPSSWQQYLKYGLATGYVKWLTNVFENPGGSSMTPTFWKRNDHAAVVARWVEAAGAQNVTVIVLEGLDRRAMFRTFAQLIGVPSELLESRMDLTSNRSMTASEAQLLLELNRAIVSTVDWSDYARYVRRGMALGLVENREPDPAEPRLHTPQWARDSAAEMGTAAARSIDGSGVRVLGDLDALGRVVGSPPHTPTEERRRVPIDVAVTSLTAVIDAARRAPSSEVTSTRALAGELWSRVKADGRARVRNRSFRAP